MATTVKIAARTATKRNRSKAKGTARRKKTTIRNKKGNVTVARARRA